MWMVTLMDFSKVKNPVTELVISLDIVLIYANIFYEAAKGEIGRS
jgi:hypothetical protein